MGDVTRPTGDAVRGTASSTIREFTCKDCQRGLDALRRNLKTAYQSKVSREEIKALKQEISAKEDTSSRYNEHWAQGLLERGGSRSDRCKEHRAAHQVNIQGMAVAHIELDTVGEVADRVNPTGPLGGLGALPDRHQEVPNTNYDLMEANLGMTDAHALQMINLLREKQVLILKAGTGTGKSTFAPYRLMDPPASSYTNVPAGAAFAKLTDLGQIVVTEPRVQAARSVADYVGGTLSGSGGVGPGYPVGYQVKGDRNHDEACQLVYVTDGTMINWMREGRLSRIGTVIVDEAHERSVNIDFIIGYLRRELDRYPHLRVIVTSATFDADYYQEFFGGPDVAHVMEVPAVKSFGYGMPLFPELDAHDDVDPDLMSKWDEAMVTQDPEGKPLLSLSGSTIARPAEVFIQQHWKEEFAPPLPPDDVLPGADPAQENVWDTTRKLLDMRFTGHVDVDDWKDKMPDTMATFVVSLTRQLDDEEIFGDILGFLPTTKAIEACVEAIEKALGAKYRGHVFPLISSLDQGRQKKALAKRRKGDARKIVISTNLAETSLTVEGVRFVVDSGIIAQSDWDPDIARGGVSTTLHSQAGIKQRWGRVGRKAPGWVFPLYSKAQFVDLPVSTPPGSVRENLEALVMTAKMGGVDDVTGFPWPAAFVPEGTEGALVTEADQFRRELARAAQALQAGGALDVDGHPTAFGKEMSRFSALGTSNALAILYADRLACVPEVATVISLLSEQRLLGTNDLLQDDYGWPEEWRLEAYRSHGALAAVAEDEAHLVLLIMGAWERADLDADPWEDSEARATWARRWWVNHETLLEAARARKEILQSLSPAMKEEAKRYVEPALLNRTRAVLTRALASQIYTPSDGRYTPMYRPASPATDEPADAINSNGGDPASTAIEPSGSTAGALPEERAVLGPPEGPVIAMSRRKDRNTAQTRISGIVKAAPWALADADAVAATDAMRLLVNAAQHAKPELERNLVLALISAWPVSGRLQLTVTDGRAQCVHDVIEPYARPAERPAAGKRQRKKVVDLGAATRDDTAIELSGARRGDRDEDDEARAAFERADREQRNALACGACGACNAGNTERCSSPSTYVDASRPGLNPLQNWNARVADCTAKAAHHPAVTGVQDGSEPQWVEVIGYRVVDGEPTLVLEPDWRPPTVRGNPADHQDVNPGLAVPVRVGNPMRHHGGAVRAFYRTDRTGRFILRDASDTRALVQIDRREIAACLDRSVTGSLDALRADRELTATIVPARYPGCFTVTLLEFLHQQLGRAVSGAGVVTHAVNSRTTVRAYPALVVTEADPWGNVEMQLAHHDSVHGITHRVRYRNPKEQEPVPGESADENAPTKPSSIIAPPVGSRILIALKTDSAELDVADLDLDALRDLVRESNRQLTLQMPDRRKSDRRPSDADERAGAAELVDGTYTTTSSDASVPSDGTALVAREPGTDGAQDSEADPTGNPAPAGTLLKAHTDAPVSRDAATKLVTLGDDDPDWAGEVWSFWARSHHVRLDKETPFYPADRLLAPDAKTLADLDQAGEVSVIVESPTELAERALAEFLALHPVDTSILATVTRVTGAGAWVLTEDVSGFIPRDQFAWKKLTNPTMFFEAGERIEVVITDIDRHQMQLVCSYREAQHRRFEDLKARAPIGTVISLPVETVSANTAFLTLQGVVATLSLSQYSHNPPRTLLGNLAEGTSLTAAIAEYRDDRREVALSIKAMTPDPFVEAQGRYKPGDTVTATVTDVTSGVVTFDLIEGIRTFSPRSLATHDGDADLRDLYVSGQPLTFKVIEFTSGREVKVSIKACLPDDGLERFARKYPRGTSVTGWVTNAAKSFVYVELPGRIQGAIHIKELRNGHVNATTDVVANGQKVTATIIDFNTDRKQVALSLIRPPSTTTAAPAPQPRVAPTRNPPPETKRAPVTARSVRVQAATVEDAVARACRSLELPASETLVTVHDDGARGLFGRVKRNADVTVTEIL